LHDGSAATLVEVLTTKNPNDKHGVTSSLSTNQLFDLMAYLLSLDGSPTDESTDNDGDGISDQWELFHGLNPDSSSDASADADDDGIHNRDEFLAGTDPTSSWSRLSIQEVRHETSKLFLFFPTREGKKYLGEYANSIPSSLWKPLGQVMGDGAEQVLTDTNAPSIQRFYRVRLAE
jgi:hypothetical protein